jgi:predicted Fe-Mo cluster-binding NifX family protein
MKLCIPIDENRGLSSDLCLHFSTAPKFLVIDIQTMSFEVLDNPDDARSAPDRLLRLLSEHDVKSAVVGGIGLTALDSLCDAGISVFSSAEDTVSKIVQAFKAGTTNPVTLGTACSKQSVGRGFSLPVCGQKMGRRHGGSCSGGC